MCNGIVLHNMRHSPTEACSMATERHEAGHQSWLVGADAWAIKSLCSYSVYLPFETRLAPSFDQMPHNNVQIKKHSALGFRLGSNAAQVGPLSRPPVDIGGHDNAQSKSVMQQGPRFSNSRRALSKILALFISVSCDILV
ncbi:hypothetical protein J3459_010995 [Metarhizium acridum]|nr:hypothetical protein J3459_011032 [Metarhizium acridum]KAG8420539.1 hypothetical protein J3459_010995 [Metarhizium acridum]